TGGDPAVTSVLFGPNSPAVTPASVATTVFDVASLGTEGGLATYSVTVPANSTRSLLWFHQLHGTSAHALTNPPPLNPPRPLTPHPRGRRRPAVRAAPRPARPGRQLAVRRGHVRPRRR